MKRDQLMANTQYTRLDEKIDKVLARIGDIREDVAVLKNNRAGDCERLGGIATTLENINGRVRKNERKISWIMGIGSAITGVLFSAIKGWFGR